MNNKSKWIKAIGVAATVIGVGVNLITDWVNEQKMDEKIEEKVGELENAVSDAVTSHVEAAEDAPKAIKDITDGVTMVGAVLNAADTDGASTEKPSVKLVFSAPETGIVIDEQQHNAVQFSMKLSGAVDRDGDKENGQQLIVPIVIDMPVPERINPDFLVILHKLSSGEIEQIRPKIYLNETDNRSHAVFIVSSFSDFALVSYSFSFDTDALTKYTNSGKFTLTARGSAPGSTVSYESSDPSVASVDPTSGLVIIHKAGKTTITATASKTDVYPEAYASYELTVKPSQSNTAGTTPGAKVDKKPDAAHRLQLRCQRARPREKALRAHPHHERGHHGGRHGHLPVCIPPADADVYFEPRDHRLRRNCPAHHLSGLYRVGGVHHLLRRAGGLGQGCGIAGHLAVPLCHLHHAAGGRAVPFPGCKRRVARLLGHRGAVGAGGLSGVPQGGCKTIKLF